MFNQNSSRKSVYAQLAAVAGVGAFLIYLFGFAPLFPVHYHSAEVLAALEIASKKEPEVPKLDRADYNRRMWSLANNGTTTMPVVDLEAAYASVWVGTSTPKYLWPKSTVYPLPGAVLPFKRIIAYYGNYYSKQMGALGEYPRDVMLAKLTSEVATWTAADPGTPAIPAINYIAVTAQGSPGAGGKYRLRMPDDQIDYSLELAREVKGIVILDVQVGLSTLQSELPALEKYLQMPEVHLGIDPEFSMKSGDKPGDVIGYFTAADVNYAIEYLAGLVRQHNLPPKVLVIHRFTQRMVRNVELIKPLPEVQVVMDMDGWGPPAKKLGTYKHFVAPEPTQFTGFKIFYKNDLKPPSTRLLTPEELLKLTPRPSFIQYQ